jgi:multidrug efflux pump subunit AcrA (membrane-fusion protein)
MQQTETNYSVGTSKRSAYIRIAGVMLVVAVLVAIGTLPRVARVRAAREAVEESSVTHPVVTTTHPQREAETSELVLPGSIQPLYTAQLYARVDGYVDRRTVDIGSRVTPGQVLAVISSPEIDQQLLKARASLAQAEASLLQSRAALEQAKANGELARLTKERDQPLGEQHAISQQIVDTAIQTYNARIADVGSANANIVAAEANVTAARADTARLEQMQKYERITAPFAGVITERNVEKGDLVSVGTGSAKPLFGIAQDNILRIQIDVPQAEAVNIHDGEAVVVTARERVGRTYVGTIARNANALDNSARTLRTEVQVDNRDGSLLAGMYSEVRFTLPVLRRSLVIPTNALVVDHSGTHVVTLSPGNTVHIVPVVIGKDSGATIEVLDGLAGTEAVVVAPSDLLKEGEHVETR